MAGTVIKVSNLSKKYRLGTKEHTFSILDSILNMFKKRPKKKTFWALKNINLQLTNIPEFKGNSGH